MESWRFVPSFVMVALAIASVAFAEDATMIDSAGHRLHFLRGGRFIQGTSGAERALARAFPLSATGQYFGKPEDPAHVTWITKPFYLAETEVTVGQFKTFVAATNYRTSAERGKTKMVGWDPTDPELPLYKSFDFRRASEFNWRNSGFKQGDDHPVVGVSWVDAKAYCAWLSMKEGQLYRLPTEAEWEFACRAGSETWFSFGDQAVGVVQRFGNLGNVELEIHRKHAAERQWLLDWEHDPEDGHIFTAPVGSYQANAWGLRDMHGNVWEWCEDLWLDTVYSEFRRPKYNEPNGVAIDPLNVDRPQTPTNDFHAIRGGSWYNGDVFCRSANRTYWDREDAASYIGFRVVRDVAKGRDNSARAALQQEQAAIRRIEASGGKIFSQRGLDIEVEFSGKSIDEQALIALASLSNLQRVRTSYSAELTASGFVSLTRLTQLRLLDIRGPLDLDSVDLSRLAGLQQLETLRFPRRVPLNDDHLKQMSELHSLREFCCFGVGGGLTDAGISQLKRNRGLESLEVWENQATGEFLSSFVGCPLTLLAASSLDRQQGTMLDREMTTLSQFPELVSLDLSGQTRLSGATLEVISQQSKLRQLTLQGCLGISKADFATLGRLQLLSRLDLRDTNAGDVAAASIARIPRLDMLQMKCNGLTDRGLKSLSAAFSLRRLELTSDALTDQGVRALGRINRLENLILRSPHITGTGLGPVAALPNLRDLYLITPGLTDVALEYLANTKSLRRLRLAHQGHQPPAALSDAGLVKLEKATWLQELWLPGNDTQMTEAQMNRLVKLLPKTRVIINTIQWKD